jgi:signal transduction histidine kinase
LLDLWRVYDAEYDSVSREMDDALGHRGHALGTTDVAAIHADAHAFVRQGIENGDWSQYEDHIRRIAAQFARDGVPFDRWHAIIRRLNDIVGARLIDSLGSDGVRLKAALHAMRRLWDQALAVIAAEFIDANEAALRDDAAVDKESSAQEDRARIARDMHDELGQQLTALKLDLGWLMRRCSTGDRDGVPERLQEMTELVDDTLEAVRLIATRLRLPDTLVDRGLVDALASLVREVETRSGLEFHLSFPNGKDVPVPVVPATAVFFAFQEILTNVVRHAGAHNVHVRVERTGDALQLDVEDDGRGITPVQASGAGSLGLVGVRERISIVHGTIQVEGTIGRGTRVRMTVPLARGAPI